MVSIHQFNLCLCGRFDFQIICTLVTVMFCHVLNVCCQAGYVGMLRAVYKPLSN